MKPETNPLPIHPSSFRLHRFKSTSGYSIDGAPAAGKFEGWPETVAELRVLDPCCGSGHFLVAVFNLLVRLRMREEGLTREEATDATLRDNVYGLELDPRCTQIAAFALALSAWKFVGGYRVLPELNIASSGIAPQGKRAEWVALANGDERLRDGMERLYDLFKQAPELGSLISPAADGAGTLLSADFVELQPLLEHALQTEAAREDAERTEAGVAARGLARAAEMLTGKYHLVITNVPYLTRGKQAQTLRDFCERRYPEAKADLATVFVERCLELCKQGGAAAIVTPHNWLFLSSYKHLRKRLLQMKTLNMIARLGEGGF
ncbi:MAG: N-6 DNA methylase [Pyrinomonadaceae bacterium]